ncbi:hypothetical protein N9N67_06925 [Bacteriovoracaceae bacterium]|nr:hypothetical protein [Bacteriovoracaceae bacterium]
MNVQILSNNQELVQPLISYLKGTQAQLYVENDAKVFFKNSAENLSHAFFIQSDCESLTNTIDMIKDLRNFFGSFPLIFSFAKDNRNINSTVFLNAGVDDCLIAPFDFTLLENHLRQSLQRESFLPIKYRTIPSGGSAVKIQRKIKLQEINSSGVHFRSKDFIPRGALFKLSLSKLIPIKDDEIDLKLISSHLDEETDFYEYYAEFCQVHDQIKKEIRFCLKNNQ